MNIENYKPLLFSFEEIFSKQRDIKFLYEPESREIFKNFDLDTYEDQEIFKKYCWRITEELMEAKEDIHNVNHFKEELIDGFNFMVELYLLCGKDFKDMPEVPTPAHYRTINNQIHSIIYQLGITANVLKNRQWRQSQYPVDLYIFEPRFIKIWIEYMQIFHIIGLSPQGIRELWSLKYQVNLFRIETNY